MKVNFQVSTVLIPFLNIQVLFGKYFKYTGFIWQKLCRYTYRVLDRPCFGLNWSATCALEVSVQLWGHFVQIWVSHLVDWFATCT